MYYITDFIVLLKKAWKNRRQGEIEGCQQVQSTAIFGVYFLHLYLYWFVCICIGYMYLHQYLVRQALCEVSNRSNRTRISDGQCPHRILQLVHQTGDGRMVTSDVFT